MSSYTLTDLGTLGGPYSSAAAINSAGEVAGTAETQNYSFTYVYGKKTKFYPADPFLWKPSGPNGTTGSLTDLGNPGGSASGINDAGQVVGNFGTVAGQDAFLWAPSAANGTSGGMIDLGTLGGIDSQADGINRNGWVVGSSGISSGFIHAFLWTPTTPNGTSGSMADLGTLGGAGSFAHGINDSGQVVGSSDGGSIAVASAAFLYSGGKMFDLGSLGGSSVPDDSFAYAINTTGQIVGTSEVSPGYPHAFLWTPSTPNGTSGSMIDLGSGYAYAINSGGQVVGDSVGGAFLWTPTTPNGNTGTMINLNTLIKSSTFLLQTATGINDQGQIVGNGTVKSNGSTHAFLLSPTNTITTLAHPASSVQPVMPSSSSGGGQSALTLGPLVAISVPDPLAACQHKEAWQHGTRDTEVEPWLAVNPTNPNNIVAIWIAHDFSGNVASVSFDGGTTWQNVAIPGISDCTGGTGNGADPWLNFAPNGVLYAASVGNGANDISRSLDGGLTWGSPITVSGTSGGGDRPSVTADPGNSNLVYAAWNTGIFGGPATVQFTRTTDGGQTWEPNRPIYTAPSGNLVWNAKVESLPDGTLVCLFTEFVLTGTVKNVPQYNYALSVMRSADKGQTWSAPTKVVAMMPRNDPNPQDQAWWAGVTDPNNGNGIEAPAMGHSTAVDPRNGNLYAVWIDSRFSGGQYDSIAFSRSTDGGLTWSSPIQVNQTPTNIPAPDMQAWHPTVAVAADGTIGVSYYDLRFNDPSKGALTDYWLVQCPPSKSSTDPASWTNETRLTDTSFDIEQAVSWNLGGAFASFLGDYQGLAGLGNGFAAVWTQPFGDSPDHILFRRAIDPPAAGMPASAVPLAAEPSPATTAGPSMLFTDTRAMFDSFITPSTPITMPPAAPALTSNPWLNSWREVELPAVHTTLYQDAAGINHATHRVWSDPTGNLIADGFVNDVIADSVMDSLVGR